jgi:predicted secreted protein
LGITGGFVYKDKSILDMLVKVFNAEQEKAIAAAGNAAQAEKNKQILSAAQGKADALLKEKKAESDGIQMIADAKAYEIKMAQESLQSYLELKRLEIEKSRWEKWDGKLPTTLFGSGEMSNFLLQLSTPTDGASKK